MSGQDGESLSATVIVPPGSASERSAWAAVPRATSTAPPAGMATAPPSVLASTMGEVKSTSGVVAGNGNSAARSRGCGAVGSGAAKG